MTADLQAQMDRLAHIKAVEARINPYALKRLQAEPEGAVARMVTGEPDAVEQHAWTFLAQEAASMAGAAIGYTDVTENGVRRI